MRSMCRLVVAVVLAIVTFVSASSLRPEPQWILTERLREEGTGHSHVKYADSVHSYGKYVVVGSVSANLEKGQVRIMHDAGEGLKTIMMLKDPNGIIHDEYGCYVKFFERFGALHLAVSASGKMTDGAVFIYRQGARPQDWALQETIYPPTGMFLFEFGRSVHYDGLQLLISSVRRYVSGPRFVVSAVNWKGTRYFQESTGVEAMAADPILVYRSVEKRNNATRLELYQVIEDGVYTGDFGVSISISGDRMAVGSSSREKLKYGHGTDGHLEVTDLKLLDGDAEYNFDTVTIRNGGMLTVDRYETLRGRGGFLKLRIKTKLYIEEGGAIDLTSAGYKGGPTSLNDLQFPKDGEGPGGGKKATTEFTGPASCDYDGSSSVGRVQLNEIIGGVKASNSSLPFAEACGGGGSFGTRGEDGTRVQCGLSGVAGQTYGDELLENPYRGSGGGSGHPWKIGSGGGGGNGGGMIYIAAKIIENYGTIEASGGNGEDGGYYSGAGGGGSGGSIILVGDTLMNYGWVKAVGGKGGHRAISSGTGGDVGVKGGDGGNGRIRFDFLTFHSRGHVMPYPKNVTTYQGAVYMYQRNLITHKWQLQTLLPRLPGMMFIGHAVALDGHTLAVASDQRTPVSPEQKVYVMDISPLQNVSSPIYTYRVLHPPNILDEQFGYNLTISNNTLVIGAPGSQLVRGVVYLHHSPRLTVETVQMRTFQTIAPTPGDYFGRFFHYAFPQLFVSLPTTHDDLPPYSARRSSGCIHLYKYVRNISVEDSFVTCDFAAITANVTLNCTITMLDSGRVLAGDLNEMPYIYPPVDFRHVGVYTFQVRLSQVGSHEIYAEFKQRRMRSFMVEVSPAIVPVLSNFSCVPTVLEAGETVTCTIVTNGGSGEDIAKKEFDIAVFNMADLELSASSFDTVTPQGIFRSPPPSQIDTDVLPTDFPTVAPQVEFVRKGVYRFSFQTWRSGTYAALARYQLGALRFPNPVVVDVTDPTVAPLSSQVTCPPTAAPNRTMACVVQLRGALGTPTGTASLVSNFSSTRYVRAEIGGTVFPVNAVWSGAGRLSILVTPTIEGTMTISVLHHNTLIPVSPSSIDVRSNYIMTCSRMSLMFNSFTIANQHALGRSDARIYGRVPARAVYTDGVGLCDDGFV